MSVFVGDPYGQLHHIDLYTKQTTASYGTLSKNTPINRICMASDGLVYMTSYNKIFEVNLDDEDVQEIELATSAQLVGLDQCKDYIVYSLSDGGVYLLESNQQEEEQNDQESILFQTGINEGWLKGFSSPFDPNFYCMVGRKVPPILIDLNREVISWRARNVPNDQLQLKVPVHDVDALLYNSGNNLAALHKDRKLRLYDIKKGQRKAIMNQQYTEQKSSFTNMIESYCQNYFYIGNSQGSVFVCDKRKDLKVTGKMKGANGSIRSIRQVGDSYVMTGSLDGYVRLYKTQDYKLFTSVYAAQPIHSLQLVQQLDEDTLAQHLQQQTQQPKQKAPKRKHTVALPYLQPRKQAKIEQQE